jgi:Protein of unknown function (DUF3037)
MTTSTNVEYFLLRYVPTVLSEKTVSIAAIFIASGGPESGICTMIYAADWRAKVRVLDPDADLEMLAALLSEIRDQLFSPSQRSDMIHQLEDSFSNVIQVSQKRECALASSPNAIEMFVRGLIQKTAMSEATL